MARPSLHRFDRDRHCASSLAAVPASSCSVEKRDADVRAWRRAECSGVPAGPKVASKPTTPVARMTDRNNGAGTVESRSGFIIPASSEPDCTAKHADAADCSDKAMASAMAQTDRLCPFPGCVACVQRQAAACERSRVGYDHHQRVSTRARNIATRLQPGASRCASDRMPDSDLDTTRCANFSCGHPSSSRAVVYERDCRRIVPNVPATNLLRGWRAAGFSSKDRI